MKKKFISSLFLIILSLQLLLSHVTISGEICTNFMSNVDFLDEYNVIENVPYVSQETGYYCAYASATMAIKYYHSDTNLKEILYYSGIGFSAAYSESSNRLISGITLNQGKSDREFIGSLFGLSFEEWGNNEKINSKEDCWDEYLIRVKQNISDDIPVITVANPFLLKSYIDPDNINWLKSVFNYVLPASHVILVVGYNEKNFSICYNDPLNGVYGEPEKGTYIWMDIEDFRKAVEYSYPRMYYIGVFKDISRLVGKSLVEITGGFSGIDEEFFVFILVDKAESRADGKTLLSHGDGFFGDNRQGFCAVFFQSIIPTGQGAGNGHRQTACLFPIPANFTVFEKHLRKGPCGSTFPEIDDRNHLFFGEIDDHKSAASHT